MLKRRGAKAVKYHPSSGSVGEPDIIGCMNGFAFVMELKRAHEKPTEIQKIRLAEWAVSGAVVAVVSSLAFAEGIVLAIGSGELIQFLKESRNYGILFDSGKMHASEHEGQFLIVKKKEGTGNVIST